MRILITLGFRRDKWGILFNIPAQKCAEKVCKKEDRSPHLLGHLSLQRSQNSNQTPSTKK